MKMKPSIALFAASALLAGVAGAQEKAAEAPAADNANKIAPLVHKFFMLL